MRVNVFAETKTNISRLRLSRWKMIVRFQSLNSTSKPKGYLFQTKKLWEELIVQRKEKATKPKEEVSLNFIFPSITVLLVIIF